MPSTHLVNVDLAKVFRSKDRKGLLHVLTWGASVDVVQITSTHVKVKATDFEKQADGSVKPKPIARCEMTALIARQGGRAHEQWQ